MERSGHIPVVPNIKVHTNNSTPSHTSMPSHNASGQYHPSKNYSNHGSYANQGGFVNQDGSNHYQKKSRPSIFKDDTDPDVQHILKRKMDILEMESQKTKEETNKNSKRKWIIIVLVIIIVIGVLFYLYLLQKKQKNRPMGMPSNFMNSINNLNGGPTNAQNIGGGSGIHNSTSILNNGAMKTFTTGSNIASMKQNTNLQRQTTNPEFIEEKKESFTLSNQQDLKFQDPKQREIIKQLQTKQSSRTDEGMQDDSSNKQDTLYNATNEKKSFDKPTSKELDEMLDMATKKANQEYKTFQNYQESEENEEPVIEEYESDDELHGELIFEDGLSESYHSMSS